MELISLMALLALDSYVSRQIIAILKQLGTALLAPDRVRLLAESPDVVRGTQIFCLLKIHSLYIYLWQIYV